MAAIRKGADAVQWAKDQVDDPSQDWTRLCLRFVRRCFNVGPNFATAGDGWHGAEFKHGTASTPPLGVPVWWTNSGAGHVVISAGNGWCYSNDILRTGSIDKVAISFITRKWGANYRGWSEDVNLVRVWRPGAPSLRSVDLSNLREAARRDQFEPQGQGLFEADVFPVEKALDKENLLSPGLATNGYAGTAFRDAYAQWQKRSGVAPPYDGIPGRESLTALARKHGFRTVN